MTLKILGTGSATPTLQFNPSAQVLMMDNDYFLIDCGEGTQHRLLEHKIKTNRIRHIFISHLHGDHYFGLIGLLSSWNLNSRKEDLTIVAPKGLAEILTLQMKHSGTILRFSVNFIETEPAQNYQILNLPNCIVDTIPLQHRVACCGFLFREKTGARKIKKETLPNDFPVVWIQELKAGRDILDENETLIYKADDYTSPPSSPQSFAYCSDTCYLESIIPIIKSVDLLYHEATFTEIHKRRAAETFHSTAQEAAQVAQKAGVKQLIIGHYSSRYKELKTHLSEAQAVFPNTLLAEEGREYEVLYNR